MLALPHFACERRDSRGVLPPGQAAAQDQYRRPDHLIAALALRAGDVVAEIGAGGGYLTLRLLQAVSPGGKVVATDIDGVALSALARRTHGAKGIETRLVTVREPGLEPDHYDLVLLAEVDHLLVDRIEYLGRLRSALRKGGRIAVSNREPYLGALRAAALAAGFHVDTVPVELPAQFLVILRPLAK